MGSTWFRISVIISAVLIAFIIYLDIRIIRLSNRNQEIKRDLAEISHIRYGLLNVNEWTARFRTILEQKILEFEITPDNQQQVRQGVENMLQTLLDEVEEIIEQKTSGNFSGIKQWLAGMVLDMEQLRDSIPVFAGKVMLELDKPENKLALKNYALDKVGGYLDETGSSMEMYEYFRILLKYGSSNKEEVQHVINRQILENTRQIDVMVLVILASVLIVYILLLLIRRPPSPIQVILLVFVAFCLLVAGVISPMIDMEVRIDNLRFQLMGEDIVFGENVMFFQSKSITEVVGILVSEGSVRTVIVGILIFSFSIVFPSLKLIGSIIFYLGPEKLYKNRIVQFFALKSGKWSMADVMAIAILMAYIGFDGIISNQLEEMREAAKPVEIMTTNGTGLLGAFYLFLGFCMFSLVLSEVLSRSVSERRKES